MTPDQHSLALTFSAIALVSTAAHLFKRPGIYSAYGRDHDRYDIIGPNGHVVAADVSSEEVSTQVTRHATQYGYRTPELTRFPRRLIRGSAGYSSGVEASVRSYEEAKEYLARARDREAGRPLHGAYTRLFDLATTPWENQSFAVRDSMQWRNQYLGRRSYDKPKSRQGYAVYYYSTPIVVFRPDGLVELNTGGNTTWMTKEKIKAYTKVKLSGHGLKGSNMQNPWIRINIGPDHWEDLKDGTLVDRRGVVKGFIIRSAKTDRRTLRGLRSDELIRWHHLPQFGAARVPKDRQSVWKRKGWRVQDFPFFVNWTDANAAVLENRRSVPVASEPVARQIRAHLINKGHRSVFVARSPSRNSLLVDPVSVFEDFSRHGEFYPPYNSSWSTPIDEIPWAWPQRKTVKDYDLWLNFNAESFNGVDPVRYAMPFKDERLLQMWFRYLRSRARVYKISRIRSAKRPSKNARIVGLALESPPGRRSLRGTRNQGSRALRGPFFEPNDDGTMAGKISDYDWWVTFTDGYASPRRYSIPMASLETARAWETKYRDEFGGRRWVYLASAPSRNSTVLRPNMQLPNGEPASDLPKPARRSLRGPR